MLEDRRADAGLLQTLLRDAMVPRERGAFEDVAAFVGAVAAGPGMGSTVARAVRGGAAADRLGFAFVAGYFAALDAMGPGIRRGRTTCLAATEVAGVHPRAIETTLAHRAGIGLCLRGQKTFVTLAPLADDLLVVARREAVDDAGRKQLVAVRIPADRDGVRIEARPPTAFAPEVPHARVLLEDVVVDAGEVLPGDGWDDWLKPFRTVEDVHVLASTAGYLLSVAAQAGLAARVASDLATVVATALTIEREGWSSAGGHVALEGAFGTARAALGHLVPALPDELARERKRLERDAPLLAIAESARQRRTAVALSRLAARA